MTIEVNGVSYDATKMPPRKVFHVLRRLAPLIGPLGPAVLDLLDETKDKVEVMAAVAGQVGPLSEALAYMPDDLLDYVLNTCLLYARRLDVDMKWHPTHILADARGNVTTMYQDIDAGTELRLVGEVIKINSAGFFGALNGGDGSPQTSQPPPP